MSIQRHDGFLGLFEYDDRVWEIIPKGNLKVSVGSPDHPVVITNETDVLHYKLSKVVRGTIRVPKGLFNAAFLFAECIIDEGTIISFDGVTLIENLYATFVKCKFLKNVVISDLLGQSVYYGADYMFCNCKFDAPVKMLNCDVSVYRKSSMFRMFAWSNYCKNIVDPFIVVHSNEITLSETFRDCRVVYLEDAFAPFNSYNSSLILDKTFINSSINGKGFSDFKERRVRFINTFENASFLGEFSISCFGFILDNGEDFPSTFEMFKGANLPIAFRVDVSPGSYRMGSDVSGGFRRMFAETAPEYIDFGMKMSHYPDACYAGMFDDCELPDYITATDPKKIIEQFNRKYNYMFNNEDGATRVRVDDCKKQMTSLLKECRSLSEAKRKLLNDSWSVEEVYMTASELSRVLTANCSVELKSAFQVDNGSSRYTVGEVKRKLLDRGYPIEVIDNCIVGYLEGEYLVR